MLYHKNQLIDFNGVFTILSFNNILIENAKKLKIISLTQNQFAWSHHILFAAYVCEQNNNNNK